MERLSLGIAAGYLLMGIIAVSRLLSVPSDGSLAALRAASDQQLLLASAVMFGGLAVLATVVLRWRGESALQEEPRRWVGRGVWGLLLLWVGLLGLEVGL